MIGIMPEQSEWLALRAWPEPERLRPGGEGKLVVEAAIPEECHIEAHRPARSFLIPTVLRAEAPEVIRIGRIRYPQAAEKYLDWAAQALRVYRGVVRFEAVIRVAPTAEPGRRELSARLSYQGCTHNTCLPPMEQTVTVEVEISREQEDE